MSGCWEPFSALGGAAGLRVLAGGRGELARYARGSAATGGASGGSRSLQSGAVGLRVLVGGRGRARFAPSFGSDWLCMRLGAEVSYSW